MNRNVLFLLVDCLRADMCWGDDRTVQTPTINHLCKRGTIFTQAIATTSTTSPSVASIMTGCYPFAHGLRSLKGYKLNPGLSTLAEAFRSKGYRTYAMVTGPLLRSLGLDRGFDEYLWRDSLCTLYSEWWAELIDHIQGLKTREPWFLFLHLWELHLPRQLLPAFNAPEYGHTKYERSLSCLDTRLGQILEIIDLDSTIVILHGDHGEGISTSLWHRALRRIMQLVGIGSSNRSIQLGHGHHVYEYLIRVPLILAGKGTFPEGKVIPKQVRQVDVFPTFLDILGISLSRQDSVHGTSLMPLIHGENFDEAPAYIEACGAVILDPDNWLAGLRTPEWKFIFAPNNPGTRPELYNLLADSRESLNLIETHVDVAARLRNVIYELWNDWSVERYSEEVMSPEEEQEVEHRLRELGYL